MSTFGIHRIIYYLSFFEPAKCSCNETKQSVDTINVKLQIFYGKIYNICKQNISNYLLFIRVDVVLIQNARILRTNL